jgi:S1-C subfamily serine protease
LSYLSDKKQLDELYENGSLTEKEYSNLIEKLESHYSTDKESAFKPENSENSGGIKKPSMASKLSGHKDILFKGLTVLNTFILLFLGIYFVSNSIKLESSDRITEKELSSSSIFSYPTDIGVLLEKTGAAIFNVSCQVDGLNSSGTGWAISLADENGKEEPYIVTNHHVIEYCLNEKLPIYAVNDTYGEISTTVYASEGGYWDEGSDSLRDIAVLKLDANFGDIKTLELQKEPTAIGQWVMVVGYPGYNQNSSLRNHTMGLLSGFTEEGLIVTDAAVNRGNSGGPMINSRGEVVATVFAVNDASNYESMGFAQPLSFHCTVAFECLDGEFEYSNSGTPLVYNQILAGDCLGYSVLDSYNLYDVSCSSDKVQFIITEEISLVGLENKVDLPECALKDSIITEIVLGEPKAYCAIQKVVPQNTPADR